MISISHYAAFLFYNRRYYFKTYTRNPWKNEIAKQIPPPHQNSWLTLLDLLETSCDLKVLD